MSETDNNLALNTISDVATSKDKRELEEVLDLVLEKQQVEVIKVKNQDQEEMLGVVLRVVKCPFNKDYLNLVFLQEQIITLKTLTLN